MAHVSPGSPKPPACARATSSWERMIVSRSAAQLRNRVGLARIGRTGDADNRARRQVRSSPPPTAAGTAAPAYPAGSHASRLPEVALLLRLTSLDGCKVLWKGYKPAKMAAHSRGRHDRRGAT